MPRGKQRLAGPAKSRSSRPRSRKSRARMGRCRPRRAARVFTRGPCSCAKPSRPGTPRSGSVQSSSPTPTSSPRPTSPAHCRRSPKGRQRCGCLSARAKPFRTRSSRTMPGEGDKGKEKDKKLTLADYDERTLGRPPWDEEHHIMVSRMNGEMQSGAREYFDKPKRKEGEGIPKTREQYVMNDRQAGWNDEPGRPGEMRKTLFNNVGSFNIGGCKDHQLPSYWRKIKDWGSLSSPAMPTIDLRCKTQPHGQPPLGHDKRTFFQALANTPGREATAFWRSWADLSSKKPEASPKRSRWNNSWQASWAQANEDMNWRCREYFSVPLGGTGRSMPSSSPSMQKHPLALTFQDALRAVHQDAKA
ncbi:unnamed protein product [Effrenium voratum]|nr:unnamed protein product [Effrenium voratum]